MAEVLAGALGYRATETRLDRVSIVRESAHYGQNGPDVLLMDDHTHWSSLPNSQLRAAPFVDFDVGEGHAVVAVAIRSCDLPNGVRLMSIQSRQMGSHHWHPQLRVVAQRNNELQAFRLQAPVEHRFWRLIFMGNHGETRPSYCRYFVEYVCFYELLRSGSPDDDAGAGTPS